MSYVSDMRNRGFEYMEGIRTESAELFRARRDFPQGLRERRWPLLVSAQQWIEDAFQKASSGIVCIKDLD